MSARAPVTINRAAVRRLALDSANDRRARILPGFKPFAYVSCTFTDAIAAEVRLLVVRRATEHWQKGVTLT